MGVVEKSMVRRAFLLCDSPCSTSCSLIRYPIILSDVLLTPCSHVISPLLRVVQKWLKRRQATVTEQSSGLDVPARISMPDAALAERDITDITATTATVKDMKIPKKPRKPRGRKIGEGKKPSSKKRLTSGSTKGDNNVAPTKDDHSHDRL